MRLVALNPAIAENQGRYTREIRGLPDLWQTVAGRSLPVRYPCTTQLQCAVILGTCHCSSPTALTLIITIQLEFLPYNYIKHSQAA